VGCVIGVQQCDQHIDIEQCTHWLKSVDRKTFLGDATRAG
jgi:hypothetical protein